MRLNLKDVENNVDPLGGKLIYDKDFIYDLLAAYGRAPSNITRLRSGQLNVAEDKNNDVAQKGVVYFKPSAVADDDLYAIIDDLKTSSSTVRYSTRFVIVTNFQKLLAIDTKTGEPLDIAIRDINKHYTFFLPWAGMEKAQYIAENHADIKAAEKMAKLFDLLISRNGYTTALEWHNLTTFFTRLLFCFFAEDTGIFTKNQFINAIASYTQEDGSDMHEFLLVLFEALDEEDKKGYPAYLAAFPYVNGKLFSRGKIAIPEFNKEARKLLIEASSKLDWSDINPDIFGSMFQAVVRPSEREGLGQHYTSVPNIMKTIEPLFLDELKEEFDTAYDDSKKLERLLGRIGKIKIFDPACGSGNFLIIAYKQLRRIEHAILERQGELSGGGVQQALLGSRISVENFYGIEIDDFAREVAILALWLAKHQMNIEFAEKFGVDLPLIPLKETGNIVRGNATREDWNKVCPNDGIDEIYVIGNPPYAGAKLQTPAQKRDSEYVFQNEQYSKNLDYVALWFIKGARYIANSNSQLAFVTTNSVSQGEHVGLLFPKVFELGLEIGFAYTSFKWMNNAKHNAGVNVAVISLRNISPKPKYIWTDGIRLAAGNINGYLADADNVFIERRAKSISGLPDMVFGSMPRDGGHLIMSPKERREIIELYPEAQKFIKKFLGSAEYIKDQARYCIWVRDADYDDAKAIPPFAKRFAAVALNRGDSDASSTRAYAKKPYRFVQVSYSERPAIILPKVSSNNRQYIPMGFVDKDTVISDLSFAIYDAEPWLFGVITSRMHMAWVNAVAGRFGMGFRYSNTIVYNSFPIRQLTEADKAEINEKAFAVLDARENHPGDTLADMYEPGKMPDDLRRTHQELDRAVDKLYRIKAFENDDERLACLFSLYETMTAKER